MKSLEIPPAIEQFQEGPSMRQYQVGLQRSQVRDHPLWTTTHTLLRGSTVTNQVLLQPVHTPMVTT